MSQARAREELLPLLELTLRRADATREDIERACAAARTHGLGSICVNSGRLLIAAHALEDSNVKLTCAVGFPLGAADADVKRYETETAIDHGAQFIEVSLNTGRLKDADDAALLRELRDIVEAADERPVSLHLDPSLLSGDELRRAAAIAMNAGVKGLTFGDGLDATTASELLRLIREVAGDKLGLKVENQTLSLNEIVKLLDAGATRFGLADPAPLLAALS
jgi:deoxyribose-phosphate aldolase